MGFPHTLGNLHVREYSREGGFFRGAGVDAEADGIGTRIHVADAHLAEVDTVGGALDAVVVGPSGEAVPHGFDVGRNGRRGPVGITVVGRDAAQVLEFLVLEFHGTLEPIVAVQVHDDAALVKALVALGEIGFHDEAEVLFLRLDLEDRGVVVAEMIVGPLPEVRVRGRGDGQCLAVNGKGSRLPGPLKRGKVDVSVVFQGRSDAVDKIGRGRLLGLASAGEQEEAEANECEGFGEFHHVV